MKIKCEAVLVTIQGQDRPPVNLLVPAYTRTPDKFRALIHTLTETYLTRSAKHGTQPSTADFVCYLAAIAALEPYEQEAPATEATEATERKRP